MDLFVVPKKGRGTMDGNGMKGLIVMKWYESSGSRALTKELRKELRKCYRRCRDKVQKLTIEAHYSSSIHNK